MLRTLFYWFIVLVVASAGYYYYQVRQINNALDDIGQQVAPFGRFDHGGGSFSATGEARVNQLRFRPHGSTEDIRVDRVAIKTGSLLKLMNLDRTVRDGYLPSQLGFAIRGLRFPLDGPIFAAMGEEAGSPGVAFDAAGCGNRQYFSGRDLASMGYLDFTGGLDVDYQLLGNVDTITWSMELLGDGMNRVRFDASIGIDARSNAFQDLAMASDSMSLRSINSEFEDLGYYERVLEFCADEMDMSRDEYIEHHVTHWQSRWLEEGMVAGPALVDAYRKYLENPGTLSGRIIPTGNVLELLTRGVEPSRLLGSVNITLSIDDEPLGPLDLRFATREDREAATASTTTRDSADRRETDSTADIANAVDSREVPRGWQSVSVANLGQFVGSQVSITLQDGRERSGRLEQVSRDEVVIERRLRGGYMEVPIKRSDIAEVQVWR